MADLESVRDSIDKNGVERPIVITSDGRVIDGVIRLKAMNQLDREVFDAKIQVVDTEDWDAAHEKKQVLDKESWEEFKKEITDEVDETLK